MSKKKILIGIFISLLAIFISVYLFFSFYFTSERLKRFIIPKLEVSLGRGVEIEKIRFNLFKGIEIKSFKLKERPGWSQKTFVSCDELILKYHFWPLLAKRLEIGTFVLKRPFINIIKNKKGEFNFADLLKQPQKKGEKILPHPSPKGNTSFVLLVSKVKIEDGQIFYQDLVAQKVINLTEIDLEAQNIGLNHSFPLKASFRLNDLPGEIKGKINPINLTGELYLKLSGDNFAGLAPLFSNFLKSVSGRIILALHLKSDVPKKFQINGSILGQGLELILPSGQKIPKLNFKGNLTGDWEDEKEWFRLTKLTFLLNGILLNGHGDFRKEKAIFIFDLSAPDITPWVKIYPKPLPIKVIKGSLQGEGKIKTDYKTSLRGELKLNLSDLILKTKTGMGRGLHAGLTNGFRYNFSQKKLVLMQGQFNFNHSKLFFAGTARPSWIKLNIQSPHLELTDFSSLFPEFSALKGVLNLDLVLKGNPSKINAPISVPPSNANETRQSVHLPFEAKGKISSDDLRYDKIQFTRFICPYLLQKDVLVLRPIYGKLLQGGNLKGWGKINLRNLAYQGKIQLTEVNIGNFTTMFLPSNLGRIDGEGEARAAFGGKGFTLRFLEKYLNAQAKVSVRDGTVYGNSILKEIAAFLDIPKLANLHFNQLDGRLHIIDGNVRINTKANQKEYGISVKGKSSLKGKLDLKAQIRLSPELIQGSKAKKLFSFVPRDDVGNYLVPFLIAGDIKSPKIKLDKGPIEKRLKEKGKETLKKLLEKKLKLKGLSL